MSEDVPLYNGPTIVITTDDGTLFSCTPHEMGGFTTPRSIRWKIIATDGLEYVGPPYRVAESSPVDVQRIVSEWWNLKKQLGQAGQTAATLRARLLLEND